MSSIVVSGDTSGAVTLTAPAVAGTVTVTLPSASGTMASLASVTSNGVAYVNSSGQPTSSSALVFDGTNLRVGTTSSLSVADKLTVVGGNFAVQRTSGITTFMGDNTVDGYAGTATNQAFTLLTNSVERLRLNTSGTVILQGGSTSANGVGITFPATQSASTDANTLDDYEEGTWTPVINGTTFTNGGWYTKVGGIVNCSFNNQAGVATAIADNATFTITGWPFAPKVDGGSGNFKYGAAVTVNFNDYTDGYKMRLLVGRIATSTTIFEGANRSGVATDNNDPFNLCAWYYTS